MSDQEGSSWCPTAVQGDSTPSQETSLLREESDAETRDRTWDLQIFSLTLSQLSYRGLMCCKLEDVLEIYCDPLRRASMFLGAGTSPRRASMFLGASAKEACWRVLWISGRALPTKGLFRELSPGPLAPEARIMPLDQTADGCKFCRRRSSTVFTWPMQEVAFGAKGSVTLWPSG